ncbi:hypothetical protein BGZ70_005842, partial [Mortierella alpina]
APGAPGAVPGAPLRAAAAALRGAPGTAPGAPGAYTSTEDDTTTTTTTTTGGLNRDHWGNLMSGSGSSTSDSSRAESPFYPPLYGFQ